MTNQCNYALVFFHTLKAKKEYVSQAVELISNPWHLLEKVSSRISFKLSSRIEMLLQADGMVSWKIHQAEYVTDTKGNPVWTKKKMLLTKIHKVSRSLFN